VNFDEVSKVAKALTPVPGGVGSNDDCMFAKKYN
jgi:5,10-methylene-tetrahydrofolate dehydrogenase/methenyl tetrahydrofolate cyclohydrolase